MSNKIEPIRDILNKACTKLCGLKETQGEDESIIWAILPEPILSNQSNIDHIHLPQKTVSRPLLNKKIGWGNYPSHQLSCSDASNCDGPSRMWVQQRPTKHILLIIRSHPNDSGRKQKPIIAETWTGLQMQGSSSLINPTTKWVFPPDPSAKTSTKARMIASRNFTCVCICTT